MADGYRWGEYDYPSGGSIYTNGIRNSEMVLTGARGFRDAHKKTKVRAAFCGHVHSRYGICFLSENNPCVQRLKSNTLHEIKHPIYRFMSCPVHGLCSYDAFGILRAIGDTFNPNHNQWYLQAYEYPLSERSGALLRPYVVHKGDGAKELVHFNFLES